MESTNLGPNGSFIYCMEFLEENFEWLYEELKKFSDCYIIFDCPGQIELYTHNNATKNILAKLEKLNFKLTAINLIDSLVCRKPSSYISALLLSLSIMLQLGLPHVNVFSKIDLLPEYGELDLNLSFYTDVQDLSYLNQFWMKK